TGAHSQRRQLADIGIRHGRTAPWRWRRELLSWSREIASNVFVWRFRSCCRQRDLFRRRWPTERHLRELLARCWKVAADVFVAGRRRRRLELGRRIKVGLVGREDARFHCQRSLELHPAELFAWRRKILTNVLIAGGGLRVDAAGEHVAGDDTGWQRGARKCSPILGHDFVGRSKRDGTIGWRQRVLRERRHGIVRALHRAEAIGDDVGGRGRRGDGGASIDAAGRDAAAWPVGCSAAEWCEGRGFTALLDTL